MPSSLKGTQRIGDANSDFNVINAAIRRVMLMMGADLPVQVMAVHGEGLNPVGFVDVHPLVPMQDGFGKTYPHGTIYNVPYIRIQGGARAIICDPAVGDIGFIMIAGRDISNVKANRAESPPGSFRYNDFSDAVYIGGLLNASPQEYIGWVGADIHVHTAGQFIVDAASMQVNCAINCTKDVTAGSISLQNHVHGGVEGGNSTTEPPQ